MPFANHNESYDWVVRFDGMTFLQSLGGHLPTIANLRPLGTALAWLTYRAGGESIVPSQWVNFVLAVVAWAWLGFAGRERRLFGLVGMLACGVCFAGYIYLFHLHGVFYSPLLILAAGAVVAWRQGPRAVGWMFPLAAVVALFHPFAVLLGLAFAAGALLQWERSRTQAGLALLALGSAALVLIGLALGSGQRFHAHGGVFGLLVSYRMVEVQTAVSVVALGLAVFTTALALDGRARGPAIVVSFVVGVLLLRASVPLVPLWIAACLLKALVRRAWIPAAVLAMAFVLPWFNPTGSPTYTVFAILLATAVTAADEPALEARLRFVRRATVIPACIVALALVAALRSGATVPLLSRVAQPLLAERERTRQLEQLVQQLMASPWRDAPVRLNHGAQDPSVATDALDRRFRAPTQENHFETWVDHRRGHAAGAGDTLVMAFGGEPVAGHHPVLTIHGRYAGDAAWWAKATATSP